MDTDEKYVDRDAPMCGNCQFWELKDEALGNRRLDIGHCRVKLTSTYACESCPFFREAP